MSEKTSEIEENSETEQTEIGEEKKNRPVERKIIKKIVRARRETEGNINEVSDKNETNIDKPVQTVSDKKKSAKKKRKWPIILLLILLLLGGILWYASPYLRIYVGNYLYNSGRYEDGIFLVQGMTENEEYFKNYCHSNRERYAHGLWPI